MKYYLRQNNFVRRLQQPRVEFIGRLGKKHFLIWKILLLIRIRIDYHLYSPISCVLFSPIQFTHGYLITFYSIYLAIVENFSTLAMLNTVFHLPTQSRRLSVMVLAHRRYELAIMGLSTYFQTILC